MGGIAGYCMLSCSSLLSNIKRFSKIIVSIYTLIAGLQIPLTLESSQTLVFKIYATEADVKWFASVVLMWLPRRPSNF